MRDDDDITRVRARKTERTSSVGNVKIVSDEGKEWIARGALRERWLEGVGARWQVTQGEMLEPKHEVLIRNS